MLVNPTSLEDHSDISTSFQKVNPVVAQAVWAFYHSNPDRVIVKVSFLKIRVRDLRILFELIAGPEV